MRRPPHASSPISGAPLTVFLSFCRAGCSQRFLDCGLHEVATGDRESSDEASRRLHIAIKLVEAGADPDNRQHGCGGTPLHHTLAGGYIELVKFLLKEKADVNASNRYGARASIHHAHTHARTPSFSHPSFLFPRSPQACTRSTLR